MSQATSIGESPRRPASATGERKCDTRTNAKGLFACALVALAGPALAQPLPLDAQLPDWARSGWAAVAKARGLALSGRINPFVWRGDFDGDGRSDLAVLIRHVATGKEGIAILRRGSGAAIVVGAGKPFGNGGDDFAWMDAWSVEERGGRSTPGTASPHGDVLKVSKEGSASALIIVSHGRPIWRQQGD